MANDKLLAGQASVWVQPGGPNTKPEYLGCHEVGDIEEKLGDITLLWCPDPAKAGRYKVNGSYRGEPDIPKTTITAPIGVIADYLEAMQCPGTLFVHKVTCGRRDLFANFDRSFVLSAANVISRKLTNLASASPGNEAEGTQEFEINAEELLRVLRVEGARQGIAADGDLTAISFCAEQKCADDCGPARAACQYGVAVGETPVGSAGGDAQLWFTQDGGDNWTVSAANPFAGGEAISAVVCFQTTRELTRILVARGTTDAGNPAEVAYSDDDGVTWAVANVGSTNGQFVAQAEGLFALDMHNIWAVAGAGYIYHSTDGGATWETQEAGVVTASALSQIKFIDALHGYASGAANTVLYTADGGVTWSIVAGPAARAGVAIQAMEVIDQYTVWLGYTGGYVHYTADGGAHWYQRVMPFAAAGVINSIAFYNPLVGFLVHDTAGPVGSVWRTIDGGYTWEQVAGMTANSGLTALYPCGINAAFVVGQVNAATAFVGKVYA
jgi:photosystem II stability/assembly factor-like uncharacterized protein